MTKSSSKTTETHSYIYDPLWADTLRRYFKSEKAKSGLTYDEISIRLKKTFGTVQTPANLKSKIARANFGAQLFLQLLVVMGTTKVDINDIHQLFKTLKKNQT